MLSVSRVLAAKLAAAIALCCTFASTAQSQTNNDPARSFAALEAAGLRIGEIRLRTQDVFDTSDPRENNWLFRAANQLHIQTRPDVIERALLFKRGDPVSARLIEETERLLRGNRYLYDVQFLPGPVHDGVVDLEVVTRDTWSLDIGASASRAGGANASGLHIAEYNLLGTGTSVSIGRSQTVDRNSTVFGFRNNRAFGTWTDLSLSHAVNSDGQRDALAVMRPFYALDTRWAAGFSAVRDDRIDSIYRGGQITRQYRHRQNQGEAFGGWSAGLINGWVQRWSGGVMVQDDAYGQDNGLNAAAALPPDSKLRAPFVRWELIEDRIDRERNRNLIGKPEFFSLGLNTSVQLGYALRDLGSSTNAVLFSAMASRGFEPDAGQTLITTAKLSGQVVDQQVRRSRLGVQAQYYRPQSPQWLFYAAGSLETLTRPNPEDLLLLGGEDGLRGFPLRYQSGSHRALFTLEERFYTDLYVWRLFRIGGAAFMDVGRAWGADDPSATRAPWLANVGAGLRIVNARSAFSNVLHIDLAMPLVQAQDVKKLQLLVKTKASF